MESQIRNAGSEYFLSKRNIISQGSFPRPLVLSALFYKTKFESLHLQILHDSEKVLEVHHVIFTLDDQVAEAHEEQICVGATDYRNCWNEDALCQLLIQVETVGPITAQFH